jgi:hypothetical protein
MGHPSVWFPGKENAFGQDWLPGVLGSVETVEIHRWELSALAEGSAASG